MDEREKLIEEFQIIWSLLPRGPKRPALLILEIVDFILHRDKERPALRALDRKILKNKQLISDPVKGDCFRACITSLLGIPNTNDLPDGDKDWFIGWGNYLSKVGLNIHYEEKACWRNGYWIASVKSLNYPDVTHAIIMNCQEVYFDPSPNNKYTEGENLLGKDIVLGGWYFEVEDFSKLCSTFGLPERQGGKLTKEKLLEIMKKICTCNGCTTCDLIADEILKEFIQYKAKNEKE